MAKTSSIEYRQAKGIVDNLLLNDNEYLIISNLRNFRKYLTEIGKPTGKQFTTRDEIKKVKIIRIR